jgi:hypothetical protein
MTEDEKEPIRERPSRERTRERATYLDQSKTPIERRQL